MTFAQLFKNCRAKERIIQWGSAKRNQRIFVPLGTPLDTRAKPTVPTSEVFHVFSEILVVIATYARKQTKSSGGMDMLLQIRRTHFPLETRLQAAPYDLIIHSEYSVMVFLPSSGTPPQSKSLLRMISEVSDQPTLFSFPKPI